MSDDSVRAVLFIERIDQERLILLAILDSRRSLLEELLGSVHKDLVQVLLLTDLIKKRIEGLDSGELPLHPQRVSESEERLKVAKSHSCDERRIRFPLSIRCISDITYLASHNSRRLS